MGNGKVSDPNGEDKLTFYFLCFTVKVLVSDPLVVAYKNRLP